MPPFSAPLSLIKWPSLFLRITMLEGSLCRISEDWVWLGKTEYGMWDPLHDGVANHHIFKSCAFYSVLFFFMVLLLITLLLDFCRAYQTGWNKKARSKTGQCFSWLPWSNFLCHAISKLCGRAKRKEQAEKEEAAVYFGRRPCHCHCCCHHYHCHFYFLLHLTPKTRSLQWPPSMLSLKQGK